MEQGVFGVLVTFAIAAIYLRYVHFRDVYQIVAPENVPTALDVRPQGVSGYRRKLTYTFKQFFKAFGLPSPAVLMSVKHLEYMAGFINSHMRVWRFFRKQKLTYYDIDFNKERSIVVSFGSRLRYLLFFFKLSIDLVLSFVVHLFFFLMYNLGLLLLTIYAQLLKIRHFGRLHDKSPESAARRQAARDYFDLWFKTAGTCEAGYLLFKGLEGYQFHKALTAVPPRHLNCEFGIDDGVISAMHLKPVDYLDFGCEAVPIQFDATERVRKFYCCYIENNPFADGYFADIYLIHIVDHIPDLAAALKQLNRILQPGGRVYFSGLSHRFSGRILEELVSEGCVYNNKPHEWYSELCRAHGFKIVYKSYMQAGLAERIFKLLYPLNVKTSFVNYVFVFNKFWPYRILAKAMIWQFFSVLYQLDEYYVAKAGSGLNFMFVIEKESA